MKIEYIDHMGTDLMVANVARVSMDKWHDKFEEGNDDRLIKYLAREKHILPFGHPKIQLRMTLPIFVARQFERHRVGTVRGYELFDQNEISRRYVDKEPEFFTPTSWRSRPDGNIKQGSGEDLDRSTTYKAEQYYNNVIEICKRSYETLLAWGVAPEQARMILPQSMMTSWVETGSLLYWSRVYKLRTDSHAQKEIQDLAAQLYDIIEPLFPVSWPELVK